jgi:thiosulfate/3-mercaptopyruvate sulfurtransferase
MDEKKYPYPHGKSIVKWISAQWLEDHLDDEKLMIIDTQPNVYDYFQEHIPGAIYMNEGLLRVWCNTRPAVYVPTISLQAVFRRLGLDATLPAVVYTGKGAFKGWGDGLEQTMMAYSLTRFGHNHIYLLDGGLDQCNKEKRPVTKDFTYIGESDFEVKPRCEYMVDYDEFLTLKDRDDTLLLDARPSMFYEGQGPWSKPGHIPGAINLPWASLMDTTNPTLLKSEEEIHAILEEKDVTPDKMIICSCGTGREATNEFLLFKWYLKYPRVKLHEGAFTEWVSYPENPTVTGPLPRLEKVTS